MDGVKRMAIVCYLDLILKDSGISFESLSERTSIELNKLRRIANNECKSISLSTLDRLCGELHCQLRDLLKYPK